MKTPTQYEAEEKKRLQAQIQCVENAPLRERREHAARFAEAIKEDMSTVAERCGWLLNGSYGFGAYQNAHEALKHPRMNHCAIIMSLTAALEWATADRDAKKIYNALSPAQQKRLNSLILAEIKSAVEEYV